jgi:hypothetical protein
MAEYATQDRPFRERRRVGSQVDRAPAQRELERKLGIERDERGHDQPTDKKRAQRPGTRESNA